MASVTPLLSRQFCRVGFGWIATMAAAPRDQSAHFASSGTHHTLDTGNHTLFTAMQSLASKLQEPKHRRLASPLDGDRRLAKSSSGEQQLQSELAAKLCAEYRNLPPLKLPISDECERARMLLFLASECVPTDEEVAKAVESYLRNNQAPDDPLHNPSLQVLRSTVLSNLRMASTPQYEQLLEYILKQNSMHGMWFLMALREDIMQALAWLKVLHDDERMAQLKDLDGHLRHLFLLAFSPGILEIRRITYEDTSASIIERIATKEAVHPLRSLDDLRSRLGSDRRVFSLFHPLLPDEPLVFVHVSLQPDVPGSMRQVMEAPNTIVDPKVATFYSISNAQPGLAGVGLGEFLLKESIRLLRREFPGLETFVTLSPIPRFRKWLEAKLQQNEHDNPFYDDTLLSDDDISKLAKIQPWTGSRPPNPHEALSILLECIDTQKGIQDNTEIVEPILMKLTARYLVLEKHRRKPLDGVGRFHVGNGAEVFRVNFAADFSRKGLLNSFGMMVNYQYNLPILAENQKNFEETYHMSVSPQVSQWIAPMANGERSKL